MKTCGNEKHELAHIFEILNREIIYDGRLKISPGVILQIRFNLRQCGTSSSVCFCLDGFRGSLPPVHQISELNFSFEQLIHWILSFLFFLTSFHNSFSLLPLYLTFYSPYKLESFTLLHNPSPIAATIWYFVSHQSFSFSNLFLPLPLSNLLKQVLKKFI